MEHSTTPETAVDPIRVIDATAFLMAKAAGQDDALPGVYGHDVEAVLRRGIAQQLLIDRQGRHFRRSASGFQTHSGNFTGIDFTGVNLSAPYEKPQTDISADSIAAPLSPAEIGLHY